MIYVTVGTMFLDFSRLLSKMDEIAAKRGEQVIMQIGMSAFLPAHAEYFDFKSREETLVLQRDARVIVAHAGIGATLDALAVRRPFVLVPRRKQFKEHLNDHQLDIAEIVQRRRWGRMVLDIADLESACADPLPFPETYRPAREPLVAAVRDMVDRVAQKRGSRC